MQCVNFILYLLRSGDCQVKPSEFNQGICFWLGHYLVGTGGEVQSQMLLLVVVTN